MEYNLTENAIRPFVVGRKNFLFCDSVAGANASANLYSLIETAKANGAGSLKSSKDAAKASESRLISLLIERNILVARSKEKPRDTDDGATTEHWVLNPTLANEADRHGRPCIRVGRQDYRALSVSRSQVPGRAVVRGRVEVIVTEPWILDPDVASFFALSPAVSKGELAVQHAIALDAKDVWRRAH